jgi:adenylosuccinate lyase
MDTWERLDSTSTGSSGAPFREALRKQAATRGYELPDTALDRAFRPERYTQRLAPVFERLARLS